MDFETILKNKLGGKFSLPEGQQTEKEKVTSWLNKGGEGSREEVNRGGGSKTGGGMEASVSLLRPELTRLQESVTKRSMTGFKN